MESKNERILFLRKDLPIIKKAVRVENFEAPEETFENKQVEYKDKVKLKRELIKLKKLHAVGKAIKEIEAPKMTDVSIYKENLKLSKTCKILRQLKGFKAEETAFSDLLGEYEELQGIKRTRNITKELEKVKAEVMKFEDKLKQYIELQKISNLLISIKVTVKKKKEKLKEIEEFIENINGALKEIKVCPLCRQPINN